MGDTTSRPAGQGAAGGCVNIPRTGSEASLASLQEPELADLAEELSTEWEQIAIKLDISQARINRYKLDNPGNSLVAIRAMFTDWRYKQSGNIAYRPRLATVLEECDRNDLAEKVRGKVLKHFDEEECVKELQHSYRSRCTVPQYPGEPKSSEPVDDVFIPLSISSHNTTKARNLQSKYLQSYNEIFTSPSGEEESPTRVFLFGKVGSGKSTLIAKMASDWTKKHNDSHLKNVRLLFVLDLTKMKNMSLHDAVLKQLLPKDTDITSGQLQKYISEHQSEVMFILDGYDKSNREHLSEDVVDLLNDDILQKVCVMVTTRPESSDIFEEIGTYRGYHVAGFSAMDVRRYVRREFDWPHMRDAKSDLKELLISYDLLPGVSTNPMMLLMMCHFWKRFWNVVYRGEVSTFTQFYNELLKHMYRRAYLNERTTIMRPLAKTQWKIDRPRQVDKLTALVKALGKLAYRGLRRPQITTHFDAESIAREISDPKIVDEAFKMRLLVGCNDLTTMSRTISVCSVTTLQTDSATTSSVSSSQSMPNRIHNDIDESDPSFFAPPIGETESRSSGTTTSSSSHPSNHQGLTKGTVTFFHESAQQKCAGEHMATLADSPANSSERQKLESFLQALYAVDDVLSRELMLRFACSSSKEAARLIIKRLVEIGREDFQDSMPAFIRGDLRAEECRRIQDYIALCLKCNYESNTGGIYNKLLAEIFRDKQLIFLGISPYTTVAVGYYLRHLESEYSIEKIKINPTPSEQDYCSVSSGAKAIVYRECKAYVRDPEYQQSTSNDSCRLYGRSPEDGKCYFYLRRYFSDWPTGGETSLTPILEGLRAGEGSQLKSLDLSEIPIRKQIGKIMKLIDEGYLKHLEELQLHRADLREQDVRKMVVLKKLQHFQILNISNNAKAGTALSSAIEAISGLPMRVINVAHMDAPTSATLSIASKISEFDNLQELRLNGNSVNEECGSHLASKLQQAKWIHSLGLSVKDMKQTTLKDLLSSIRQLEQLRELHIGNIEHPVDFIRGLTQIMSNARLELIYCDAAKDTPIPTEPWSELMRQIEATTHMKSLTLLGFKLIEDDLQELLDHCQDSNFEYLGYSNHFILKEKAAELLHGDAHFLELLNSER